MEMQKRFGSTLQDKVVVVTGSSKGIGQGLAKIIAQEGAIVALAARDLAALETVQTEIEQAGGRAHRFALDLRRVDSIRSCFADIEEQLGPIDVLVNNAGMGNPIPAEQITEEDWDWMMDLNLKGTFFCCQEAGKRMLERNKGRIVNISSQASVVAIPHEAVYCASKGGLNMLTKTLAVEWSGRGVTVNAVGPTFVYTPGTAERLDDPQFLNQVLQKIPRGRVATIEDVASAVMYLASDHADMVTGTLLLVDGGWTAV
ncbi:MAG: SDR family NAD(P)-dependent oxidoreductase [Sphaerochaeta sp.]|jgi:NAD(P)-dependent dehydrogenase (short-subunit alcohol dehydrogenase family)|uniref:SDR family NAD(P)-dependent oxidoreductase n=1 Tax=Sphaerochaeta sp. TaxID=1972642 RepID=UPI002FCAB0D5